MGSVPRGRFFFLSILTNKCRKKDRIKISLWQLLINMGLGHNSSVTSNVTHKKEAIEGSRGY